jgi:hypothetical protein
MSHKADAVKLVRQLREEGFQVQVTGGGHWEVRIPGGERVCTFAQTPSDRRWRQNALGDIRRWKRSHGIPVEQQRLQTA